jgi:hypothetical protein
MFRVRLWFVLALLGEIVSGTAATADTRKALGQGVPEIRTSDVQLFYRIYDAANGAPSAEVLQKEYLDAGTDGVRQFIPDRIASAEALAKRIAKDRAFYDKAGSCMGALPEVQARLAVVLPKLELLLPDAQFPPVTILIGRNNSGGTSKKAGVLIALEKICSADWLEPNIPDRLVHLISHEYIHVQQPLAQMEDADKPTVLQAVLTEGVAEFVAELISGSVADVQLQIWLKGCDARIAPDFRKEMNGTDVSHWLYNGVGIPERPGDMGYWVGYRIAKLYYQHSTDRKKAVQMLILPDDPQAILAASRWGEPARGAEAPTGHDSCKLGADYFPPLKEKG